MIKYKGIIHNVLNDAPFIGAILIAPTCSMGCKNCINEHLKTDKILVEDTAENIIKKVKSNGLNRGIILSGLEWTESATSMQAIMEEALIESLEVIIYTHHDEKTFLKMFPSLSKNKIYIKYGAYDECKIASNNISYGVKLATENQYIKYYGA
jgi:pyruvate-formate lyase-activating enzyme